MKNKYIEVASHKLTRLRNTVKSFSLTEKIFLSIFVVAFSLSTLIILAKVNSNLLVQIPDNGGTLTEGIIGTPRFINPVIANSNADRDLTSIIYSGLVKVNSENEITPDVAERFEVSEDGLIYDFYLREDVEFHDGETVMADDIVYTILKIQDPEVKSPHIANWDSVAIEKVSDRQVRFILSKPDPNFILKTGVGILPKHLWQEISSDAFSLSLYNIEPIGSGPYKLDKVERDTVDIPQYYVLKANKKYSLGKPLINKIIFKFAKNEEELVKMINEGKVNSVNNISPATLDNINLDNFHLVTSNLPRVFSIFINQTESPALSINSAREALRLATPKTQIINEIFNGYATEIDSPIPNMNRTNFDQNLEEAEQVLIDAGWEKNEQGIYIIETDDETYMLSTSISTGNTEELVAIAELIAQEWRKIGVEVSVKIFNTSDLNQNVIRPRNFEALLFGNVINNYAELYAFWHSSRRNDPGLNITNYANIETDAILEKFLTTPVSEISEETIDNFVSEIQSDIPAIFLYSPQFLYLISKDIQGVDINEINIASDRFNSITNWFINTDRVWKVFTK